MPLDIWIIAGQSNMAGRGRLDDVKDLEVSDNDKYIYRFNGMFITTRLTLMQLTIIL